MYNTLTADMNIYNVFWIETLKVLQLTSNAMCLVQLDQSPLDFFFFNKLQWSFDEWFQGLNSNLLTSCMELNIIFLF